MINTPTLARAFAATRAMLALIGFAAVAGYLLVPHAGPVESWLAANQSSAAHQAASAPIAIWSGRARRWR